MVVGEKLQSLQCRLHRLDVQSPESITGFAAQVRIHDIVALLSLFHSPILAGWKTDRCSAQCGRSYVCK